MSRFVSTTKGVGRLDGETVTFLDVDAADLGEALRAGYSPSALAAAAVRERAPFAQVELLPTIPRPSKIWAVGFAYAAHRSEVGRTDHPDEPHIFMKAPSSVIASGQPIRFPRVAPDHVDYEGELAVVVGRRATDVEVGDAMSYVAGYTICNDVSARDVQKGLIKGRGADVSAAKSFDTFTPMGPCLATLDEFDDPADLHLQTWVDGELRQDARTSDLIHPVGPLLSYLSRQTTLEPGDVLMTGTPAGVGHPKGRYLRSGSEVRIAIEGIGTLVNRCA